jgi:phage terminase Nu1 subunit (DNA packaging protein)
MELLTKKELAAHLKVSVRAIDNWQAQGMPSLCIGRLRRYRLDEVLAWHDARQRLRASLSHQSAGLHPGTLQYPGQ